MSHQMYIIEYNRRVFINNNSNKDQMSTPLSSCLFHTTNGIQDMFYNLDPKLGSVKLWYRVSDLVMFSDTYETHFSSIINVDNIT